MVIDRYQHEREREEAEQKEILRQQGLFDDMTEPKAPATKSIIPNPDVKIETRTTDPVKQASLKVAEFELLKMKAELLSKGKASSTDHRKLAEIISRLM